MKKKSTQRIAAWLLAAGMMAGTFAQPMAVYAESTASIAASDSTTGDSITADADVVIATPTPEPDTGTDTAATPVPTADSQTPQDPASTAAPETTPAPDAAEDAPTPTPTPAAEDMADDAADTDDTTDTTTTVTPADLQSCIALLAASQLSLDADSIEPDVREETLALSDEITETEPSTLQAVVNAAVFAAPAGQTDIVVDVPADNYTGTLVIPDATIVVKDASGNETKISYTNKNITLNMTDSTLTVPTDAAVGVSVFGSLTIQGGTIKAADGCTATRGVQVQLGSALTLDGTTISDFTYAGPGAGVYVKGTAAVDTKGQYDVVLGDKDEPVKNSDGTYQFKKLQRENGNNMDTSFTMKGGATITNCKSDGNGAALYVHNAALLTLESANFTNNNAGGFGGAVYLGTGVQTTIGNGVTFTGNHAAKDGGALYLANQYTLHVKADNILVQVPVTFNGGTFTDNSTDTYGGALAFDPAFDGIADNTIENVTFGQAETTTSEEEDAEGETTLHGNYAALRGGAIAFNSNIKENTLKNCTFRGNTALRYAGAVYYPNNYSKTSDFNPVYTVDGCTFDRNSATYDEKNGNDAGGGAILIQVNPVSKPDTTQWAKLYVKGSTFTGNTATGFGGAISTRREAGNANAYIYINVDGSTFNGNRATSAGNGGWRGGGAVWVSGCAWADFTANTFTGNYSAHFGGAIASNNDNVYQGRVITLGALREDGTPDPDKANTFTNNSANSWGGAISTGASGSGDNTNGIYTTVRIYGGSFAGNTTLWGSGGALYVNSGTQRDDDLGLEVIGTTFTENKATHSADAGAVYIYGITSSFKDCKFTANSTEQTHGGAMRIQRTKQFDMDNVTFTDNTAGAVRNDGRGGAIFINDIPSSFGAAFTWNGVTFEGNTSRSYGGAVGIDTSVYLTLNATNITASNNKSISQSGGAFYLSQGRYTLTNAVFENNIAGSSGGAIYVWNQYSGNSLTINGNSSFTGNTAGSSGGAVQFESNNQYRTGADGNLEYCRGELKIIGTADNPIVFSNNTAKNYSGGALCIGAHNTDKLDYLDVYDNTALRYGGGIYINNSTTEGTLTNSKICNNTTSWAGGGVGIHNYLDFQETKVDNATKITRTGKPGDFTIQDCEITGNSTTGTDGNCIGGGGISITSDLRRSELYKEDSGTVNIIDTVVEDNTTTLAGGGIYCGYNGTNNISGGSISNNTSGITATTAIDAVNKYKYGGGAVAVRNNTTTIKGGTVIAGNTSGVDGGALYVKNADSRVLPASLTTEDCTIANNTAKKGGIAYVSAGASFAMGEKTAPDSNEGVGDVFVEKNAGEVTLPAAKQLKGKYDAWLMDDATPIEKAVTNDSSAEHYYTLQGAARFVARLNGLLGSKTGKEYTTLQAALDEAAKKNGNASIDLLADVGEQVTATTVHNPITLNLNGYTLTGKITLTNNENTNAFTLTDEKAANYKAGSAGGVLTGPANGIEMNNGTRSDHNTLILTGKTLTLRNLSRAVYGDRYIDVTAKDVTFTGNTSACIWLNNDNNIKVDGAVFTKNTGYSIVQNSNDSTIDLKNVKIYENNGNQGGRVYLGNRNTLTVDGGEYHDNATTSQNGGVIFANGLGNTVTINSGEFYNNKAVNGGAVCMWQLGNLTINGGSFHDNTATTNGGAIVACNATGGNHITTLTITGGEIYNNTAVNGGAVYMSTGTGLGTFTMTGGEIYENTADNGGALYIATKAKVTLSAAEGADVGGIIRDNAASQLASNLYLGGADSSLTVGEKTLLHGGTIAGDVLFAQGGTVDLANTQDLHTDGIENAKDLVWLKNDATTGKTVRSETAPAQTIYTLAPAGENTGSYAARIGSDKYFSINQAIKAMEAADAEDAETNTTIHLLRDQTEDVTINNTKHSPTLNLNGYTLTGHITVNDLNKVGLTFTLTDDNTQADYNKAGKGGTLTAASGTLVNIKNQSNKPENTTVKLQGMTLTGSTRGVYAGSNVNLVAEGSSFSGHTVTTVNTHGAAISYGGVGTLVVNNCKFADNRVTANGHAGAIFMNNASCKATITNSTFTNNQSESNYGGAMWLAGHAITLRGNTFAGNTAGSVGGAVYLVPCTNVEKAAAETEAYSSYDAVLENNTFENNKAYSGGGALYITPSTITVTTLVDRCTFTNNSSTTGNGGAVYNNQGTLTLGTGNLFEENKSYNGGSGMYVGGNLYSVRDLSGVELPEDSYDTQFIHNTSGYGNYSGGNAALSVSGGATKNMRYMLFDRNVAAYGNTASAIYIGTGSASTAQRDMWIDHCRFVNNVGNRYTVYVDTNYTNNNLLKINDTVFDSNTVKYGRTDGDAALLYIAYGNSVQMSDCTITKTQGEGRVLRYYGGGTLDKDGNAVPATGIFTNVTITDNKNCYYTPVSLTNANSADSDAWKTLSIQAQSTWTDCTITGNAASITSRRDAAGDFEVYKQNVTLDSCTISDNSGPNGGVYVSSPLTNYGFGDPQEGVVTFTNCDITGNHGTVALGAGGMGISYYQSVRGIVNLKDCTIKDNTGSYGGGIRVGGNDNDEWATSGLGTLNATNCTISGNTATVKGGGIFASAYDTEDGNSRLHLTNCTITNNTANYGGGIYAARQIKPEKRNKDNQYRDYYVDHAADTQTMIVTRGTIADNIAQKYGGGISTDVVGKSTNYNTLIVKVADGTVENNRAQLGQDVYAYKTKADTVLHLPKASAIHDNGRWLNENTSETLKDEPIDYDPIQRTYPLTLSVPKVETEVAQIVKDGEVVGSPYDSLQEAMDAARAMLAEDPTQKLTVQLLTNTNSSTQISQDTNVTLDLAGHTITGIGGKPALTVESDVAIIGGGTISGTATDGGALLLRNNANVTMTDTTITNSRAAYRGGAVCVDSGSSFTLGRGSTITGCQAGRGGAVYVIDGSFTQTDDAVITNCSVFENAAFSACGYGGAVYVAKGIYTLQSGSVTNNSATKNGIIYIANNSGAEFTMTQGEISGNTCKNGTIYQEGGTMTLAGGSITGNTCTESGGGVYQNGGSSLLLGNTNASHDVVLSGNKAVNGAGWYINGGNCLMRGGNITGNKATKRGGGVCQSNGTLTVNGGDITTNNAPEGGGLCHSGGTFNFQGGGLYGNIATGDDGGNDVYSTSKNGVMDLIAAAAMDSDKYNVWRDDYYPYTFTKNYHNTSDKIAAEGTEDGGKYLTMDNVADADLNGVEAELTDKVNGYFNYTDEGKLRDYAKNESTYNDNYDNSSTLGMNISRGWGGNASYITKTNYWLGSDGKTVLNDDQNKQLGTNVTGIASKVYMTGNLAFGSEEVTPANNTDTFIYDAQVDQQTEYYYLTAYDVLMKFDPSAMRPATYMVDGVEKPVYKMSQKEVAANLKDVTHISLSDNGYSEWDTTKQLTQNYELTILYAAKAKDTPVLEDGSEGNGWQYDRWERADGAGLDNSQPLWEKQPNTRDNGGTADMDKYSFNDMEMTVGSDGATKEIKGLVYYDTLTELEKAGHTCVAVLYQIRNCCVRTGRSVEIGHMMEVTKDVSKIGRSYALTMDVRGWTTYRPFYRSATATGSNPGWTRLMDNGTVLTKRSELLYQGLIEGTGKQADPPVSHTLTSAKNSKINWDIGTPTISRITNNYQKTQYSNGYEVGGSHSGYLSGNTVLLATQNATVEIETTDVAEGNIRQTDYQLDEGQRTVTVQVTPRVTMQSNAKANLEVFDGTTQTDLTLDVKLPQDLTLQEGTLTFDYSNSSYNRGDLTWEAKYQYWDGTTWQDFDFKTNYEQSYVQQPTRLQLTTTITDVKKVLPVLSFKAGIGYPADPGRDITDERNQDGAWYKNLRIDAEIHTTYEEEDVNASLGRTDYTEIKVLRNSKTVVNKTAASNLVEIGDVLAYDLTYINEGGANSDLELCDLLPYNTEKAKTFHGAYALLNLNGDGVMGMISIPKINQTIPIYHGTDDSVLQVGAGHLPGTALPVGGENTHCVLAAHRGLPSARLFSDIDQLEEGDMIYLHILGEVHAYRVENILPMVPKDDFETLNKALRILHGQDWLSLMTCTPYGINTHRLIVQAKRVAYNGEDDAPTQPVQAVIHYTARSFRRAYTLYIGAAVIILLVVVLILRRRKKRHSPKQ